MATSYEEALERAKQSHQDDAGESAVKTTDAPVEKTEGTSEGTQQPEEKTEPPKKEFTPEEKQEHAFQKRFKKFDAQIEQLKRENAELRARLEPKPSVKTRADFNSDDEFAKYVLDKRDEELIKRIREQDRAENESQSKLNEQASRVYDDTFRLFGKANAEKIWGTIRNPNSESYRVLSQSPALSEFILGSDYGAELLLDLCQSPHRYERLAGLSPDMQKLRLMMLEENAEELRRKGTQKATAPTPPRQTEPLPTAGQFGVHGTGTTDISGLSATERVERYKKELRDKGLI